MEQTNKAVTDSLVARECNPESHVDSALSAIRAGLSRREFMGCEEGDYRWALYDAWDIALKALRRR